MAGHRVYRAIVGAVRSSRLTEPFTSADFRRACPGFAAATYNALLDNSCLDNDIHSGFYGTHPDNQLRIIYTRQKCSADTIKVCEAYLELLEKRTHSN